MIRAIGGVLAVALASQMAHGATYTIDSSQSHLSLSFVDPTSGMPASLAQFAGSDTEPLSGTLDATTGGGSVTFNSSSIGFGSQAGIYPNATGGNAVAGTTSPLPDLPPASPNIGSTQTANYGLTVIFPTNPGDPLDLNTAALAGYAAIDSALASLTGSATISAGSFDTTGLTYTNTAGNLDFNLNTGVGDYNPPTQNFQTGLPFALGSTSIAGSDGQLASAGLGTIAGNTITIPIQVTVPLDMGIQTVNAVFSGQIVATTRVPEPGTMALALLGGLAVLPAIRSARGRS
ncbi:MAG TPA: hypothetical protein VHD36_21770 [Pirellulales bacterium]|nr:hypothetical protein [Pirellulales bacterium]